MGATTLLAAASSVIIGVIAGYVIRQSIVSKQSRSIEQRMKDQLEESRGKGKEIVLEAQEQAARILEDIKREERERKNQLDKVEERVVKREETLDKELSEIREKENALASFSQILARHPNAIPYLIRVASIQGSMGRPADARATLRSALKIAPDNADVYAALATLDLVDGKPEQALELAKQMQQRKLLVPEGYILEGDILMRQGKYAEAVQPYRAAFALRKDGLSAISVHQSMVLSGRAGEADQQLLQWLAQQPAEVQARVYLASSLARRGLIKAAIQQYQIVLTHAPKNVAALNNLAMLYQQEHDPRAMPSAEKAYQLNPDDPAVADTLGWILVEGGSDLKRGTIILKQAVTGAPRLASIRYHYAVALWKGGNSADARKELDAALKAGGAFPEQEQAKALRAKL